ncbi:hypothetical protein T03_3303 [Trichinella britovi]|uniref:Uncharacterized protein n=1 Tax=Trichinella britovi TaxID=45882 RepID=A0A0V1CU37_TRIBR|nr:hypothetical protein T03_3303 [Trichinella britovi]
MDKSDSELKKTANDDSGKWSVTLVSTEHSTEYDIRQYMISFCVGHEYFSQRSQCHVDYYKHDLIALIEDSEKRSERCFNPSILVFVLRDFLMVAVKYMQSQSVVLIPVVFIFEISYPRWKWKALIELDNRLRLGLCLRRFFKNFRFFKNLAAGVAPGYAPGHKKICIFPQA